MFKKYHKLSNDQKLKHLLKSPLFVFIMNTLEMYHQQEPSKINADAFSLKYSSLVIVQ